MNDQGSVYSEFIATELARELDRRDKMNSQAMSLATTAGGLLTLSLAAIAFLQGKTYVPTRAAKYLLAIALGLYIMAVILALWASISRRYRAVTAETLTHMLTDHWTDPEVDARNIVGRLNTATVGSLRAGNEVKARLLIAASVAEIAALAVLGAGILASLH